MALSDLVQRVAHRLYHDALRHGAASVDIGMFGERLFDCEAAAVVESGDGAWWTIGKSEPTAPFVAVDAGRQADRLNSESGSDQ